MCFTFEAKLLLFECVEQDNDEDDEQDEEGDHHPDHRSHRNRIWQKNIFLNSILYFSNQVKKSIKKDTL